MDLKRFLGRYKRFFVVSIFLLALMVIVQMTGLRENFSLAYLRQTLSENRGGGLAVFVLLFTLGNLVQIPGWIFLASAVFVLGLPLPIAVYCLFFDYLAAFLQTASSTGLSR